MLEAVDLTHAADRHVGGYSLGMRQRLGLAAALLGDPPVLVLDEPGNGLDPQGIRWLRDLLRERAAAGGTVFVSSHLLAEVEHLADEIVVLNHGQLVATGTLVGAAAGRHLGPYRLRPDALTQLLRTAGATVHTGSEGELVVRGVGDRRDRRPRLRRGNRPARAQSAGRLPGGAVPRLDEQRHHLTPAAPTPTVVIEPERQAVPL